MQKIRTRQQPGLRKTDLLLISIKKEVGMLEKDIKLSFGRKVKPKGFECVLPAVCQYDRSRGYGN